MHSLINKVLVHKIPVVCSVAVFLLAGHLRTAGAQVSAAISGMVTDQTGAALRDVAVTIKNVDTGATRTIATDGGGHFQSVRPASGAIRDSSGKTRVRR